MQKRNSITTGGPYLNLVNSNNTGLSKELDIWILPQDIKEIANFFSSAMILVILLTEWIII